VWRKKVSNMHIPKFKKKGKTARNVTIFPTLHAEIHTKKAVMIFRFSWWILL
jgi:hypothetical protein